MENDVSNSSTDSPDIENYTLYYNITDPNADIFCKDWKEAQHTLFQVANLCFAVALLIPHNFRLSVVLMRCVLIAGFLLFLLWAGVYVCAPDIFGWNLSFVIINLCHVIYLVYHLLPSRFSSELIELYLKLFKPLRMNTKHFKEFVNIGEILTLDEDTNYALEGITPADERLSILLSGKLKVTCEGTNLHFIHPNQFIDSPEWEQCQVDSDELFQVTITAVENSRYICWSRRHTQQFFKSKPFIQAVLHNLIGKDITHKLYSLNEQFHPKKGSAHPLSRHNDCFWKRHFTRSVSVDAVHTGTTGTMRSHLMRSFQRRSSSSTHSESLGAVEMFDRKLSPEFEKAFKSTPITRSSSWRQMGVKSESRLKIPNSLSN